MIANKELNASVKLNMGQNYNTMPFRDMDIPNQALYLFRHEAAKRGWDSVDIIDYNKNWVFFRLKSTIKKTKTRIREIPMDDFLELEFMNVGYEAVYNLFRGE